MYDSKIKILIGIVAYKNTRKELEGSLNAILKQELPNKTTIEIHVLPNCSTDYTWLNTSYSEVQIHKSQGNIGFGSAHNRLMGSSSQWTHYIALNPDGTLHPNAVNQMLCCDDGCSLIEARQIPLEHPKYYNPSTYEVEWCSGACLMLRRDIYKETGGFDDDFFMYCEDIDLSWRWRSTGGKCRIAPRALFAHDVESNDARSNLKERMHTSALILAHKWNNTTAYLKYAKKLKEMADASKFDDLIKTLANIPKNKASTVPKFENGFYFGDGRW
jgi:N-acetylglucosaminyl-diphospho-decaprenol L-rhamnosyltransferase